MVSQKTLILSLGLVVVVATLALPLSALPSLQSDAEDHQQEETPHSPGMRRLTWWRWGRRNNNKKEKATTEPPTTTEVPVTDYISTTKKPSRWRSWFSRAKEKISNAAKKVKGKYERGMSVVDNVAKHGFYKAGKAIVLGVKKVGNATITVGRKIKKGTKRIGSAVKRGYQKIRLKFSGPDEKFKILANRIKDKVESGDGRAVDLLKKIGIHITLSDQKITGSHVVSKNISVTEILKNEGMLSNKTSSSYHTALEDPEITASTDRTGINESNGPEISPAEDNDEFHSAEEYLTSDPNITDTKVEYEKATTEVISLYESPILDTDRYETSSTIHQDTTTELSESTFSENFTFLTESSSHEDMEYNIESTSSFLSTTEDRKPTNIPVTNPSTDSVFKEHSSSSTITTGTSDSPLHLATISSFNESTKHSSVHQPLEETLLPIIETTTASLNMNKTGDTTSASTIIPTTPVDIHPAISVNTIHPLNLDISVTENSTSGVLDEYKMTTLQHSSAAYINRDISPTTEAEAVSLSTLHDTSPVSVTSPDFIIPLSEETSSFTSTITATPPTSTPTVTYASTTLTPTTDPPTTSSSTLPPTTSTVTATSPITSEIVTTVLLPIISISTTSEHLPTTLPQTTSTSTIATSIPITTNLPSTTSTFTTTTLPTTISTSTTTTLPPTTSIPISITLPSTTSTSTTTTPLPTTSTSTTTTPLPTTSTSTTTTPLPTISTSTTTTPLPTTSTSTTTTPIPTTSTSTTTTPIPTTSTSTTTTPIPTTSTSTTTTPIPTTSTSTTTTLLPTTSTSTTTTPLPTTTTSTSTTTTPLPTTSTSTTTTPLPTTSTSTTTTPLPTTSTSTTTAPPPTTLVVTIPPTTTQPPPPTTTIPSTYPPTPTIRTNPPTFTETKMIHLAPTSPSTSIHGDKETVVEEAYVPPPFPDVFSDIEVHDRLREFYDNGDFSHAEMAELFNFDPDNYEYYKYDYNYEDYAR